MYQVKLSLLESVLCLLESVRCLLESVSSNLLSIIIMNVGSILTSPPLAILINLDIKNILAGITKAILNDGNTHFFKLDKGIFQFLLLIFTKCYASRVRLNGS